MTKTKRKRTKKSSTKLQRAVTSSFTIEVRFLGGLTPSQQQTFETAAARWSEIIVGDLPTVIVNGEAVDDLLIFAQGLNIDGPFQILGRAGPTHLRPGSRLPARGVMEFDTADLARLEAAGGLRDVIVHEMGHVLGIGAIWNDLGLVQGVGTANPIFTGQNAMREFGNLLGNNSSTSVPVANTGGPGTQDSHWRESVFGNELMTGFLDMGNNPVSRVTIAALADMGYQVNPAAADQYTLPSPRQLALMGIGAEGEHGQRCCMGGPGMRRTKPVVLPDTALTGD